MIAKSSYTTIIVNVRRFAHKGMTCTETGRFLNYLCAVER